VPLQVAVDALVVGAGLDREHSLPQGRHEGLGSAESRTIS